jgi:hypothetical protein
VPLFFFEGANELRGLLKLLLGATIREEACWLWKTVEKPSLTPKNNKNNKVARADLETFILMLGGILLFTKRRSWSRRTQFCLIVVVSMRCCEKKVSRIVSQEKKIFHDVEARPKRFAMRSRDSTRSEYSCIHERIEESSIE